ncbi:MAG: selenocysteine-specific translation elongation factor [Acidobacteriaceae bacterium]|nr:selenocysteine-specific translation elongation factor [Acidobacteriaceae bacterium]
MKSVIVGTAGHIDHGKTALVKALTGIDADRLEEEKRRGITIDIGFAHLELPESEGQNLRLGFVDVPGHERFVRNMLAGIGGIDLVLLVIAADESIKPQTREHFDICRLLSVRRGITVLTKTDLVDRETLEVVRLEVEDFVRGSFLDVSQAPMIGVSSRTGDGIGELKRALISAAATVSERPSASFARLPIDRVFTMKGFGTVVTGTLISGAVRKEDELELFPGGQRARVRGVQVHGQPADQALAGERTALNLPGISTEELSRGMTLGPLETLRATTRLDAELSLLVSAKPLKNRARVHFHSYTSETIATVNLSGKDQIAPGEISFAQFRLSDPILLLPGDRFIIRQFSPVVTVGGGRALENAPPLRPQRTTIYSEFMTALSTNDNGALAARVEVAGHGGLTLAEAVYRTGWRPKKVIEKVAGSPEIVRIGEYLILKSVAAALENEMVSALDRFHKQNPLVAGMSREALRACFLRVSEEVFARILEAQVKQKKLELAGELVKLPGRGVVMKDEEAESQKVIEAAFASAGLKVPAMKEVLAGLKVDRVRAQKIVTLLLRDKVLVKVSEELLFHKNALKDLRQRVTELKSKSTRMDVAQFKDLTGVTRKYAIPLLEYLDREHVTRREGDERIIL